MGVTDFDRSFIHDVSNLVKPVIDPTSEQLKGKNWRWLYLCDKAFEVLNQRFTTAPVLWHYNLTLPNIVEMDTSDFAIRVILVQKDNRVQPVAF
jgi:hypothetical protein